MIYFGNRLIIGGIKKIVKGALSFVYKLIKVFNLQLSLLVVLVGAILFFTGAFENNATMEVIFLIVFIISVFYAAISSVRKVLSLGTEPKEKKARVEIIKTDGEKKIERESNEPKEEKTSSPNQTEEGKPKYYRVKQNPQYVMAEYSDRYELYYRTESGLKKVRTDYKENENGRTL